MKLNIKAYEKDTKNYEGMMNVLNIVKKILLENEESMKLLKEVLISNKYPAPRSVLVRAVKAVVQNHHVDESMKPLVCAQILGKHIYRLGNRDRKVLSMTRAIELAYFVYIQMNKRTEFISFNMKGKRTLKLDYTVNRTAALDAIPYAPKEWRQIGNRVVGGGFHTFNKSFWSHDGIRSRINLGAVNKLQNVALRFKSLPGWLDETPLEYAEYMWYEEDKPYHNVYRSDGARTYAIGFFFNPQGDDYRKACSLNLWKGEKLTKRGLEWVYIDLANMAGYDKLGWDERLKKGKELAEMEFNSSMYENPAQGYKLYKELREDISEWNSMVGLDSTWSGGQVMALMSRCAKTGFHSNVCGNMGRQDVYTNHNRIMQRLTGRKYLRSDTKKALMTHFYMSRKTPKSIMGRDYAVFQKSLSSMLPGAESVRNQLWKVWMRMPDKSRVRVEILDGVLDYDIQKLYTLDWYYKGFHLKHKIYIKGENPGYRGFVARVIHFIDGWIALKLIERCSFPVVHNHDKFFCHPNHVDQMRREYVSILKEVYEADVLGQICRQFGVVPKYENTMKNHHISGEYALS